jgi:hypothetical protein
MKTGTLFSFAVLNNCSMCWTVLFAFTLSPTTPQVAPSGLKKSFWGSVTTSAVVSGSNFTPGLGSCAMTLVMTASVKNALSTGILFNPDSLMGMQVKTSDKATAVVIQLLVQTLDRM